MLEQESTDCLSKVVLPSLAPSDLLLIARTGDRQFFEGFLQACERTIEQIRPLQLATLIGIRRNSHLHSVKTMKDGAAGEERVVVSCPFELSLIKKVHSASSKDVVLLNQLIVNLTHMGCYDTVILATLRNKYLENVLGAL